MDKTFLDKYTPKVITDIVGNKTQIYQIKEWIENFEANKIKFFQNPKKRKKIKAIVKDISDEIIGETGDAADIDGISHANILGSNDSSNTKKLVNSGNHSCLLIIGDHGVGKTCTVTSILNNLEYATHFVNLPKVGTNKNKNIEEHVDKMLHCNNIFDHLSKTKAGKIAMVVDELESANSPVEKNFVLTMLKKNEEKWFFPIIFISNGKHSKITTVLKKNANIVQFFQPSRDNLKKLLIKVCHAEKMHFESEKVADILLEHSQNDYRRLVSLLDNLKLNFGSKDLNLKDVQDYCIISKKKDTDVHIYKATAEMIVNYQNIDECLRLYEGEKVIIPLVMHQNYIKCIIQYHKSGSISFALANDIARSIAMGDVIENYIYSDQNWDMQEVHGFLTCVNPSFKLSRENLNIGKEYLAQYLKFPIDLNRTSIKKINHRNVVNSNVCLKNLEIKDFIYANRLVRKLIEENKLEECAKLFSGYGIKIENLESVLKIDKINETKTVIPTQVRKKLSLLLATQDLKK